MKADKLQYSARTTNFTTTSTSYADVTDVTVTFTPDVASNLLVLANVCCSHSDASGVSSFVVDLDGVDQGDDPLMISSQPAGATGNLDYTVSTSLWITGVAASAHTIKLQAKVGAGTVTVRFANLTVIPFAS